ncbi:MAG: DnaJ domain-containing protein [Myxococcaceae bacterium]
MLSENVPPNTDQEAALAEEVELPLERKREILAREAALAEDHYATLGLKPGASAKDVSAAYHEASRVFHPDRYFGKKLGSYQGRLERVFRRLAEAHATLVDEAKRDAYLRAHPRLRAAAAAAAPARPPVAAEDAARAAERRARLARHPYLARGAQAKSLVAEAESQLKSGATERALGLLHRAQKLDPRANTAAALRGEAVAQKNAERAQAELARARAAAAAGDVPTAVSAYRAVLGLDATSHEAALAAAQLLSRAGAPAEARPLAQKAVDLQPGHVASLVLLGTLCSQLGMNKLARRHLEAALERDAGNVEVKQLLKKLRWV